MNYLKGIKVILRPIEQEDLNLFYQWENNGSVWAVSHTLAPYSKHVLAQYIQSATEDIYSSKQLRLVIEKTATKQPVGFIDLFDFDPFHSRVGIGILIADTNERNQGLASEALTLMMEYIKKHLGLHQAFCNITKNNPQSIQLFEKAGFSQSGVKKKWIRIHDQWVDEYLYQLIF